MLEADRHNITEVIDQTIIPQRVLDNLSRLQSLAPTTSVLYTRTPIIHDLLQEAGILPNEFIINFNGSRSPAVFLESPKPLWVDTHSDQPAYKPPFTNETTFPIYPICAHRPKAIEAGQEYPSFPAQTLRYNSTHKLYEVVSEGLISTDERMNPFYIAFVKPKDGFKPVDLIAYAPSFQYTPATGLVSGNMDNAAGVALSILAMEAIKKLGLSYKVGWLLPDGEEGLPGESAFFGRGARIAINNCPPDHRPSRVMIVDGHDTQNNQNPKDVVLYGAYVSAGKGAIVPPDLYAAVEDILQGVSNVPTEPTELGHTLSRSNDVAYMNTTLDIIPVGYPILDPHHNRGIATVNLNSLVNTAKAIVWIAASMR